MIFDVLFIFLGVFLFVCFLNRCTSFLCCCFVVVVVVVVFPFLGLGGGDVLIENFGGGLFTFFEFFLKITE